MDMNEFYRSFVPGEEQKRIQALEPFDEFEVGLPLVRAECREGGEVACSWPQDQEILSPWPAWK